MFEKRREKLIKRMDQNEIDAILLVPGTNMYYFSGLKLKQSERLSLAVISKEGELTLLVPQVELSKTESISGLSKIYSYSDEQGPVQALVELLHHIGAKQRVGVEYGQMRVNELKVIDDQFANIVDASELISALQIIKDEEEILHLKNAINIIEESFIATLPYIKEGVKEIEIAALLEFEMRKRGSEGTPFGTTVASGYRGALPHGRATDKVIQNGELIVIDFGAISQGYVGDTTRTVAVGRISDELREIYKVVKEAQQAAVDIVRPGISAHDVDDTARKIIAERGYAEFFTHRTGHGVGLSGHEEPYIRQNNQLVLEPGMIFTIEPGIYLPNKGGVRIEDEVLVTKDGFINLMSFPKDLIIL